MRVIPFTLFIILALALAVMLVHQGTPDDVNTRSGKAMPAINVTTLDGGKQWDAKQLKGKVTLINFFASWCAPCAVEMPELVALKKQFPHLQMEGIAWNDKPETLHAWLKKHGNPFHGVWLDTKGDATIDLGLRGIPETLIIDSKGMIRWRLSMQLTAQMREGEVAALVTELLKEAGHAP